MQLNTIYNKLLKIELIRILKQKLRKKITLLVLEEGLLLPSNLVKREMTILDLVFLFLFRIMVLGV